MVESSTTSVEQLESMLRDGRISSADYERLRGAMIGRSPEPRKEHVERRLRKSWTDRELGGVCGGLARYYDVSSTRIRVSFLVLLFLTGGTAIAIYFALYLLLPWDEDERGHILTFPWKFAALVSLLSVTILMVLEVAVPHVVTLSRDLDARLPDTMRVLLALSDSFGDVGMIGFPIGVLVLIGLGAALSRHGRAYAVFTKIVVGVLVAVLTLQAAVLAMFLLTHFAAVG